MKKYIFLLSSLLREALKLGKRGDKSETHSKKIKDMIKKFGRIEPLFYVGNYNE